VSISNRLSYGLKSLNLIGKCPKDLIIAEKDIIGHMIKITLASVEL